MQIIYLPQVGFATENSNDWKWYLPEEVNQEVLRSLGANSQVSDGHVIALGWNMGETILCNLSIFNAMTYQVILCRKYQGLWFPLTNAHSFDLSTKEAKALPGHLLVPRKA